MSSWRALLSAGILLLTACSVPGAGPTTTRSPSAAAPASYPPGSVPAVLAADGRFETLLALLAQTETTVGPPGAVATSNVLDLMADPAWDHTLFAPTDEAFAALPPGDLAALQADADARLLFVRRHVIEHPVALGDFANGTVTTPAGPIEVQVGGDRVTFGGATLVEPDVAAGSAIIHVVDAVVELPG